MPCKFLLGITTYRHERSSIEEIIEKLHQLKEQTAVVNRTDVSTGAWINMRCVSSTKDGEVYWYVYAKCSVNEPIFKRNPKARLKGIVKRGKNPSIPCHQHIGRVGSSTGSGTDPEVTEAYQKNRKQTPMPNA
ncbi:hypothetical protein FD723_41135 (plasmid) [Nostoc sp. C052]|uniref:hypothetical protein n=1 Tax=Nostoc sp. C052 TaxID=2576902 RepID=UPI0015C3EBC3|nr:hypothetical protein [Nostoc sp. C052]QLE46614.1 hypothetical protein FD723_41135 [Nostoc sp. C052]